MFMCILLRPIKIALYGILFGIIVGILIVEVRVHSLVGREYGVSGMQGLESGDLIFRSTRTLGGETVLLLGGGEYSHVGLISVENGGVFVIHVVPDAPSVVRAEKLQEFIRESVVFAVYRVESPREVRRAAVLLAKSWVGHKSFDKEFNLRDDDKLYCTELVYDAYRRVGVDLVGGRFRSVLLPLIGRKEVIYPKDIIDTGHVRLVYKSSANKYTKYNFSWRLTMKKKLLLVLVSVLVVLVLAGCSSGPEGVVKGFFKALDAGKVDKAMEYLSTSTLNTLGHDKWQAALTSATHDLQSKGGLSSVKVVNKKVHGDTATVTVKLIFGDGSSETDTIDLIKENGDWKIQMMP